MDIKPANLMVDEQGTCWVTDFGLARALEASEGSCTGDLGGTLAFMAPEQFSGTVDARCDVYSIGLTLYSLLTGHPAFQAADRAVLLKQIMSSAPERPRKIRAEIPRDLETIVLKAIAREPRDRYQLASDLESDLLCYLHGRPIEARRTSAAERCLSWCRRNPLIAGLTVTAGMLLGLVAATATVGYAQTHRALAGERTQRERAEAVSDVAINVLDRVYERFAPPTTAPPQDWQGDQYDALQPAISEGTAAVLEDLLVFYDALAMADPDRPSYRENIALASRRVGDIQHGLGQLQQAKTAYERSLSLYSELAAAAPQGTFALPIARTQIELGIICDRSGLPVEAKEYLRAAIATAEKPLMAGAADSADYEQQITRATQHLQWIDDPLQRFDAPPEHHPPSGPFEASGPGHWDEMPPPHDGPRYDGPPHEGPPHDGPPHDGPPFGPPQF